MYTEKVIIKLEPLDAGELFIQIGARLDYFNNLLKEEAHKGINRIKEITTIIERLQRVQEHLINSVGIKFDR